MFTHVMITRAFSVFFILFFTLYYCKQTKQEIKASWQACSMQ